MRNKARTVVARLPGRASDRKKAQEPHTAKAFDQKKIDTSEATTETTSEDNQDQRLLVIGRILSRREFLSEKL